MNDNCVKWPHDMLKYLFTLFHSLSLTHSLLLSLSHLRWVNISQSDYSFLCVTLWFFVNEACKLVTVTNKHIEVANEFNWKQIESAATKFTSWPTAVGVVAYQCRWHSRGILLSFTNLIYRFIDCYNRSLATRRATKIKLQWGTW